MQNDKTGRKFSGRLIVIAAILAVLALLFIVLSMIGVNELVDIWWFDSLGYQFYYWQRLLYRYLVFACVSLFFFMIFFLNFWIASRSLKRASGNEAATGPKGSRSIIKAFQNGSILVYAPLSLIMSIPLAMPLYQHWDKFLFFVFGQRSGVQDAFFGRDISYYLFSFPIYNLLQQRVLFSLLVLLAALFLLYIIKNRLLVKRLFMFSGVAKWHLSILVLCVFGIEIWDLMLQRYGLVYDPSHQPLFFGPGYVQMKVTVPLLWAGMGLLAATGVMLLVLILSRKGTKVFIGLVVALAVVLAARYTTFFPEFVQTYWVKPNEIEKESPYIRKSIQATLGAYALNDVNTLDFQHQRFPIGSAVNQVQGILRNIPVWDPETLETVFQQLQELRTYYTFPLVSVGRYTVADNYQQVFLSPRELEYDNLPGDANNWINNHLIYTHGNGVVMTPASQVSGSPMTWFVRNIPAESEYGIEIGQTRIYYGLSTYPYAIAPNKAGEMDYPKGGSNVTRDYEGSGGVPISSLARKALFAYYFGDRNIFFSTKITKESKVLFRRQISDRIRYLAPYLMLDQTPYVAVTTKGVYWMIDAYTTSAWYPAAATYRRKNSTINYIRNSVKIVVDAYNGSVDFYVFDENDPIINAYRRIYPGFYKKKESMPEELKKHVRYPKGLFDIQMQIYAKYHQTDPQVFFQQEDLWTFAEALGQETTVPLKPYYLTLDLIEPGRLEFMLLVPMFPKGRDNLRSIAVVGCDEDNYGKIILYDFPKGELVYGPAQIDALINQDPSIAQQFTLWDQAGSSVVRGKMIIMPVEKSIFFIQPVYLKSTSRVSIPELQRIIMSERRVAVMETSLEAAYETIQRHVREDMEDLEERFPTVEKRPVARPESEEPPPAPDEAPAPTEMEEGAAGEDAHRDANDTQLQPTSQVGSPETEQPATAPSAQ